MCTTVCTYVHTYTSCQRPEEEILALCYCHTTANNAPINIMPHYPPPGQCRGNGGVFDLILTLKVAPYVGNLTHTITHVRKCVINRNYTFSEKVCNMTSEKMCLSDAG